MQDEITFINNNRKPLKLYKYYGKIEYAIEAIKKKQIYFSMSDSFNDIFDSNISNTGALLNADVEELPAIVIPIINKILHGCSDFFLEMYDNSKSFDDLAIATEQTFDESQRIKPSDYLKFVYSYAKLSCGYEDFFNTIKSSYIKTQPIVSLGKRVSCFSEINDSLLLWSYYADKHAGVCLEYDTQVLKNISPYGEKVYCALQKVNYSETQYNNPYLMSSVDDLDSVLFNKALCWSHEQEWRLVLYENIEWLDFPCLTGVYLGTRFRSKHTDEFPNLLKACKVDGSVGIYEAYPDSKEYKVNFKTLLAKKIRTNK